MLPKAEAWSVFLLYKLTVSNHVTNSTLLLTYEEEYRKTKNLSIVSHLNPIQTNTSYVIKMVINVILRLYLRHTGSTLTSCFPTNIFYACIISATKLDLVSCPSHSFRLNNNQQQQGIITTGLLRPLVWRTVHTAHRRPTLLLTIGMYSCAKLPMCVLSTRQSVTHNNFMYTVYIYLFCYFLIYVTAIWRMQILQMTPKLRYVSYFFTCYKPQGSGFDSRWCHWNFSWT
jgi:hypothetical protein